ITAPCPGRMDVRYPIMSAVLDVHVTGSVYRDSPWVVSWRRSRRAPVPVKSLLTVTRDSTDDSRRINLADTIASLVCDVDVSCGIDRDSEWQYQFGRSCWAPIATRLASASARNSGYDSGSAHLANTPGTSVGNIKISGTVPCNTVRCAGGRRRRPAIPSESGGTVAGNRGDDPITVHLTQAVRGIREVEIATGVDKNINRED